MGYGIVCADPDPDLGPGRLPGLRRRLHAVTTGAGEVDPSENGSEWTNLKRVRRTGMDTNFFFQNFRSSTYNFKIFN